MGYRYSKVECPELVEGQHAFYILECADGTLYCGTTNNVVSRLKLHNKGTAAIWTRGRRPVQLVYFEKCDSLLSARRRESQVKGWGRQKKENLISGKWKQQL